MNITEALNEVLPEIPARLVSQRFPRIHPGVVFKEQIQDGEPDVRVFVPDGELIFHFSPQNWEFVQLFNGVRNYEEVSRLFFQKTGIRYATEETRELADSLDSMGFWYKTPLEKNVSLMRKSAAERRKLLRQKKTKWGDLSLVMFPAFDPDNFLDWFYRHFKFIYTWWFTLITLAAFAFMTWIIATNWGQVARDTFQFYNFTEKTWGDVATFWLLTVFLMCIHEGAHGLSCKHYGAHVHSMGFALVYLGPAFYTDTTEGMILGDRNQRLMISVAGVWSELIVCAIATPIWWGTAPGTAVHELAYIVILITGFGVILINWNPLMKLDGYNMLCEIIGIDDLKEESTLYVSSWVKKYIWRLPVEVPYIPKRRRLGFAVYAILSGLYSYTVLYIVARFVGNAFRNFNPDWSFIPELGTAAIIFRSRIRALVNFMKFVYLDKKDRVLAWFTPQRSLAVGAVTIIFLLLPLWRETTEGPFLLEPAESAVVRSMVPGLVTEVNADEGVTVNAGQTVARLRNIGLESQLAHSQADYQVASARANAAVMRYADAGPAAQDRDRLSQQTRELGSAVKNLELRSPISGVVLTPRAGDHVGTYVDAGTELLEVADLTTLRARLYVSEHDMYKLKADAPARIQINGVFGTRPARTVTISHVSSQVAPGLIDTTKYQGLRPPNFYLVDLLVENSDGDLKPGMNGTARLYGKRKSLGAFAWQSVANFAGRKIW